MKLAEVAFCGSLLPGQPLPTSGYAYMVPDDVEVGDEVLIPPNAYVPVSQVAVVVCIGSNYTGPVKSAQRREVVI